MTGHWKKLMMALLLLSSMALLLSSCMSRYEKDVAEAQAKTEQARYDYLAAQAEAQGMALAAQARADAQTAMAASNAQIQTVVAQEETKRQTAWLSILPWLALIVILALGVVGAAWLVLWFRGRAHLVTVKTQAAVMMLPPPRQWPALPARVQRAADENDADAVPDPRMPGAWLLICADGRRIRMLPPPR